MYWFRFKQFLKYNNAAIVAMMAFLAIGASVLAAPSGREALGAPRSKIEGIDNAVLISTDLDKFRADYKIERIEADDENYFVLYTYNDLVEANGVWQEMAIEKTRKISKNNLDNDLGLYLAAQLSEENATRIEELKALQEQAIAKGPEKRVEVTEYSGLIGKALSVAGEFTGYEPVRRVELPSPIVKAADEAGSQGSIVPAADNMKSIYDNYMATHSELASSSAEESASSSIIVVPAEETATTTETNATSTVNF